MSEVLAEETGVSEKLSNLSKVTPPVSSGGRVSTLADQLQPFPEKPRNLHSPPTRVWTFDFPDEFRQFYYLHSCPCYLYWRGCQISHPVLGPVLHLLRRYLPSTPCGQARALQLLIPEGLDVGQVPCLLRPIWKQAPLLPLGSFPRNSLLWN